MSSSNKSLKSQNLAWLWSVVAADAVVSLLLIFSGSQTPASIKDYAWLRVAGAAIAPVVVLLLTSLLSSDAKAVLVFWRFTSTLPGHRAFSVYATKDSRIDLNALRKNVGVFPEGAKDQNTTWYKLYKKVDNDVAVAEAHRQYLLFRDLATISLLLAPLLAILLYAAGAPLTTYGIALVFLVVQYGATAVAARQNGIRLVTNVLALHAVKRRADAPPTHGGFRATQHK